ncbi:MAG: hypothetical protein ACYDA3_14310 [Gaiellaceae bacterium]
MKRAVVTMIVAVLTGGVLATTPALGSTPTSVVKIGACAAGWPDIQRSVPAGSEIVLWIGWGQTTRGGVMDFLHDVTTSVLVNGVPVVNADSYWSGPQLLYILPSDPWWVTWTYPTGIVLAAGETLTVQPELVLAHPLADPREPDYPLLTPSGPYVEPGSGLTAPGTCTITGV